MKKIILALALIGILTGCQERPVSTSQSNNPNINVDYLFEKDGCKVYRFMDGTALVYFTNCAGKTSTIEKQGKQTVTIQSLNTLNQN